MSTAASTSTSCAGSVRSSWGTATLPLQRRSPRPPRHSSNQVVNISVKLSSQNSCVRVSRRSSLLGLHHPVLKLCMALCELREQQLDEQSLSSSLAITTAGSTASSLPRLDRHMGFPTRKDSRS